MADTYTTDEVLRKIAKAQKHAEGAIEVGNIVEAENYSKVIQRLLNQYRLSMTDVDFGKYLHEEEVIEHRVKWADHGLKNKYKRILWVEELAIVISSAYGCKCLVATGCNRITFVGRINTCKVAEYTLVVLVRFAEHISQKEYDSYYFKCQREGCEYKARGFKSSFLRGFNSRICQRLQEELNSSSSTAIVRCKKESEEAQNYVDKKFKIASGLVVRDKRNYTGYDKGTEMANDVNLKEKAIDGEAKKSQSLL